MFKLTLEIDYKAFPASRAISENNARRIFELVGRRDALMRLKSAGGSRRISGEPIGVRTREVPL